MKKFIRTSLLFAALLSSQLVPSCSSKQDNVGQKANGSSNSYIDGGESKTAEGIKEITADTLELASGFHIVNNEINLVKPLEVKGEKDSPVNIIVADGATLNIGSVDNPLTSAAISGTGALYIFGQKDGSGIVNIYTKDVEDAIKVGQYIQKGGNITINNVTESKNSNAITVNEGSLRVEKGSLKLTGSYKNGLKAAGIFVTGGKIDITGANITGDAINSSAAFKTEKGSEVTISNVTGNGIVASGIITLEGKVNVNVNQTAIKSNTHIILSGQINAITNADDLTIYHGIESGSGRIAIYFIDKDPDSCLKATDFKVNDEDTNVVYVPDGRRVLAQYNDDLSKVFEPGDITDLAAISNVDIYPAYGITFAPSVNGNVTVKDTNQTYFRPNREVELSINPDEFYEHIADSLVTNVEGTNVNVTQIQQEVTNPNTDAIETPAITKYSIKMPTQDVVVSADFTTKYKGKGTVEEPFLINNLKDWKLLFVNDGYGNGMIHSSTYDCMGENSDWNKKKSIRLDADLVIKEANTVKHEFKGLFNGNGHTITLNIGSENAYASGNVTNVETINNASLFAKALWGFKIENLILDGYGYYGYEKAAPLIGLCGNEENYATETKGQLIRNIWVKTRVYAAKKFSSSLVGVVYSTGNNNTRLRIEDIRISDEFNSSVDGDGSCSGLIGLAQRTNNTYRDIAVKRYVNDAIINMPNAKNYSPLQDWIENYTNYFEVKDVLFAPQEANVYNDQLFMLSRNGGSSTYNKITTGGHVLFGGPVQILNDNLKQGSRGYTLSANGSISFGVYNNTLSKESQTNAYTGLAVYDSGLMFNNTLYAAAGTQVKVSLSDPNDPDARFEIVGTGQELVKETATENDVEYSYYTITMPSSNVVIGKKA